MEFTQTKCPECQFEGNGLRIERVRGIAHVWLYSSNGTLIDDAIFMEADSGVKMAQWILDRGTSNAKS